LATLRLYLAGRVCLELVESLLDERRLGGRQGRLALTYLACERTRAVPRGELADVLWPAGPPPSWDTALSAVVSNLRRALAGLGLPREALGQAFGCYQLLLPAGAWIDLEDAARSVEEAEAALGAGDPAAAYGWAGATTAIARRRFLAGEDGDWVEARRAELRALLVRGLDCFVQVFLWSGETLRCTPPRRPSRSSRSARPATAS
jgi:DNA-binding SARP family transcriptional activator